MDEKLKGRSTPTHSNTPSLIPLKINNTSNKLSSSTTSTNSSNNNDYFLSQSPTNQFHHTPAFLNHSTLTDTETLKHRLRLARAEVASL